MHDRADHPDPRRRLPAVGKLLEHPRLEHVRGLYGRDVLRVQARAELDRARRVLVEDIRDHGDAGQTLEASTSELIDRITSALQRKFGTGSTRVLNATGIFLHTNLGRAPLAANAAAAVIAVLEGYSDLELDLETGVRGDRNRRAAALLTAITGAEAAIVTNNNAAALVLALATFASGREVIVSRGELVEIGGSFRIPDILAASGCRLVEVGTTNRTRLEDYRKALTERSAVLLKVHPSNYRIDGFVESTSASELVTLGREAGIPVLIDEGSGLLERAPSSRPQLGDHASIRELIEAGADMVCGSGDKLLGGPQCGMLVGGRTFVDQCHRNPLYRALRPDRMCFAALEATLRSKLADTPAPIDRLWSPVEQIQPRIERIATQLDASIVRSRAYVGGGAAPEAAIDGHALAITDSTGELAARLRRGSPAVVGYLNRGRLILDLRTIDPRDDDLLVALVEKHLESVNC